MTQRKLIDHAVNEVLLAIADDELVCGHRDSEWCAFAPMIEEDVAFASIAQDEMGHARLLYQLLEARGQGSLDQLAFGRPVTGYKNAQLLERKNAGWAQAIARHLVYDLYDDLLTGRLLEACQLVEVADIARLVRREERYHLEHQETWINHLGHGGDGAKARLDTALGQVLAEAGGLFEDLPAHRQLAEAGLLPGVPSDLQIEFSQRLSALCLAAGLSEPAIPSGGLGGRLGQHTADMSECLATMTEVLGRAPGAIW